jgi:hypothetical protein
MHWQVNFHHEENQFGRRYRSPWRAKVEISTQRTYLHGFGFDKNISFASISYVPYLLNHSVDRLTSNLLHLLLLLQVQSMLLQVQHISGILMLLVLFQILLLMQQQARMNQQIQN